MRREKTETASPLAVFSFSKFIFTRTENTDEHATEH